MAERTCSVPACDREVAARGWCINHYKKWRRNGVPERTTADKFFAWVVAGEDECWQWTGRSMGSEGYALFNFDKQHVPAHRWSYEYFRAEIPDGLVLDHLCRVPLCVNPWHLEPVTQWVNVMRGVGITSVNARKTHCIRGHEFTPGNTYRPPKKPTHRDCRACRREVGKRRAKARMFRKE